MHSMHNIHRPSSHPTSGPPHPPLTRLGSLLRMLVMLVLDLRVEVCMLDVVRVWRGLEEAGGGVDGAGREEGGERGVLYDGDTLDQLQIQAWTATERRV